MRVCGTSDATEAAGHGMHTYRSDALGGQIDCALQPEPLQTFHPPHPRREKEQRGLRKFGESDPFIFFFLQGIHRRQKKKDKHIANIVINIIIIAGWALSSLHYRIATFALQRTFRFTPLGLAFCFFPF